MSHPGRPGGCDGPPLTRVHGMTVSSAKRRKMKLKVKIENGHCE